MVVLICVFIGVGTVSGALFSWEVDEEIDVAAQRPKECSPDGVESDANPTDCTSIAIEGR